MGWTKPFVLSCLFGGLAVLIGFVVIELRSADPMFRLDLFRSRTFTMGSIAALLGALARGGLQFILIIWLQGIWLPLHGYSFEKTPLWAGIYLIPVTVGFLVAGPLAGRFADRYGARPFATLGLVITAVAFLLFDAIPIDFDYPWFALIMLLMGLSMGLFAGPNTSSVMNTLPPNQRGAGAGMLNTFQNSASVLSIGVFFTIIALGLAASLPDAMYSGLVGQGVSPAKAHELANLPPIGSLFAAFLGYNPTERLLGPDTLSQLDPAKADFLTGHTFFPNIISGPFGDGLRLAFAAVVCLVAAGFSWLRGKDRPHVRRPLLEETAEGLAGAGDIAAMEDGAGSALPSSPLVAER